MCKKLICIDSNYKLFSDCNWAVDKILKSEDILIASTCDLARRVASELGRSDVTYVCGCDDMEPVNLCAALVKDSPTSSISLVVEKNTGSISTRANAAGISYVMGVDEFLNTIGMFNDFGLSDSTGVYESAHTQLSSREAPDDDLLFAKDISEVDKVDESESSPCIPCDKSLKESTAVRNSNCWVMSTFSGCGGVGKSTVSAVAANLLSAIGNKVLLADFDFQFGDLSFISSAKKILTFDEVERNTQVFSEIFSDSGDSGLVLLKSPEKIEDSEVVSKRAIDILSSATNYFDAIVVNTSSSWSDIHADLLNYSDKSLFLLDQKASSVRGCKHALELVRRLNISNQSFSFALNRCSKKAMLCGLDVVGALDISDIFELKDGGYNVEELLSTGNIGELLKSKNSFAVSLFNMLCDICPLCKEGKKSKKKTKKSRWNK